MSDYREERYDPSFAHCRNLSLVFDGSWLKLLGAQALHVYPAVSGRPIEGGGRARFEYDAARQRLSDEGPIPAGVYWIRPDELWENAWYRPAPTSAWGNYRIAIHPFRTTGTHGRGGFFIHGGDAPGSAGCIDLWRHMDSFVSDLRRELTTDQLCQIHLRVRYASGVVRR
jgi:hypothetical protein